MQEEQTDAQLVMRTQADDTSAFNQLIERYQVMLICIALRYVADEEVARELVSARIKSVGVEQQASIFICSGLGDRQERQEYTIQGDTEWIQQDLIVDIPRSFPSFYFGIMLQGKGQIWLQDAHLEIVNP